MNKFENKYDPLNKGVLFVNKNKKNEDSPHFVGSINVAGVDWTLFGRKAVYKDKQTGEEKQMLKLSVAVPMNANKKPAPKTTQTPMTEDNWSDLDEPF